MPHSVRLRKKREREKRALEKRVKKVRTLALKIHSNRIVISLPKIALGDLRRRFEAKQTHVHLRFQNPVSEFTRVKIENGKPLHIHGSDEGLLFCGIAVDRPDLIENLDKSIELLSTPKHYNFKGTKQQPLSTELNDNGDHKWLLDDHGDDKWFIESNKAIFQRMSSFLGQVVPGVFKNLQRFPLSNASERLCGIWSDVIVNNGRNNLGLAEICRDVQEALHGYSCIISCGKFTGGGLILYQLGYIIELAEGDMVIFPNSLIRHSYEPAEGVQRLVVAYT